MIDSDRRILKRCQLSLVANVELGVGLRLVGDTLRQELMGCLERMFAGGLSTQAAEEFDTMQKNSGPLRGAKKYRKPQRGGRWS